MTEKRDLTDLNSSEKSIFVIMVRRDLLSEIISRGNLEEIRLCRIRWGGGDDLRDAEIDYRERVNG